MSAASANMVSVRYEKRELAVDISTETTVGDLKAKLQALTRVDVKRQKLVGIPPKAPDSCLLSEIKLKKLMLIGTPAEEAAQAVVSEAEGLVTGANVKDDLDFEPSQLRVPIHEDADVLAKIDSRAKAYAPNMLNPPRDGKKCLVLDVDCACRTRALAALAALAAPSPCHPSPQTPSSTIGRRRSTRGSSHALTCSSSSRRLTRATTSSSGARRR